MSATEKVLWGQHPRVQTTAVPRPAGRPGHAAENSQKNFDEILDRSLQGSRPVSFSSHAQARLATRHIQLSEAQISRLQNGVDQAAQKGARDSLVMLDNLAFIVSVNNRKVVTALEGAAQSGNVFTQIDSAVIV